MKHIDVLTSMIPSNDQIDKEVALLKHFDLTDLRDILSADEYEVVLARLTEACAHGAQSDIDVEHYVLQSTLAQFKRYHSHLVIQNLIDKYTAKGFEFFTLYDPLKAALYIKDEYTSVYYIPSFVGFPKARDIVNLINPKYSNVRKLGFFNNKTCINNQVVTVLEMVYFIINGYDHDNVVYEHLKELALKTRERV